MPIKPTYTSVIKNRGFRFLWTNQVLVQLAYNTLNFALIVWVFKLTDSNLAVSGLLLSIYLPSLFFGLFSGFLVDKTDRRKIILIIDVLMAVVFVLFIPIKAYYPLILINTFLLNTLAQFFMPTESSAIPLLLKRQQLLLGNSLFSLTLYGSFMVGFSIAGPILGVLGVNVIFLLGMAATLLAAVLSLRLPHIRSGQTEGFRKLLAGEGIKKITALVISETKTTMQAIHGNISVMTAIILLAAAQGVIGVLAVLMSSYMERVLHIHATDASFVLMIPMGLGMISGVILIGRFANRLSKRAIVSPAIIGGGLLFLLAGLTPFIASVIQWADLPSHIFYPRFFFRAPSLSISFAAGAYLLGICAVSIIVPSQTIIQENTNGQIRGKVFAVLAVLMNVFAAVPVILSGALADLFGVIPVFIALGAVILAIGIVATKPHFFFEKNFLPERLQEFLGLEHWNNNNSKFKS